MIGIEDINGIQIAEGDNVEVRVNVWSGSKVICKGIIEYRINDLSSWGCGYCIKGDNGLTFLSSLSRSGTEIEILRG